MRRETTETDSNASHSYSIPVHADFLIAYSTIPGECLMTVTAYYFACESLMNSF